MNAPQRRSPVLVASLIFGCALVFATIQTGHAAPPPPPAQSVLVTNTAAQAVPTTAVGTTTVAGSVNVAGTVAAQQSGPWSVAINNTAAGAVPVRIVAEEPWSASCLGPASCNFLVPENARLVIENISCGANMAPGHTLLVRVEGSPSSGQAGESGSSGFAMVAPVSFQYTNGSFDFYGCNHRTLQQIGAGGTVHVAVVGGGALSQATVNLSGHLVPVS